MVTPVQRRLLLVRHAPAVPAESWPGLDESRPLTEHGRSIVRCLREAVHDAVPDSTAVFCSPERRCHETASLLAETLGVPVVRLAALQSEQGLRDFIDSTSPDQAVACLRGHSILMPVLARMLTSFGSIEEPYCPMGGVWQLDGPGGGGARWNRLSDWEVEHDCG